MKKKKDKPKTKKLKKRKQKKYNALKTTLNSKNTALDITPLFAFLDNQKAF